MKNLRELLNKMIGWFNHLNAPPVKQSKFIDLAPTDKADEAGVYSDALLFATDNPKISNIALTGPYGSGKSSIIQSFLTKYRRPVLQISLAAFLPEATAAGGTVSKQEIERSILQQMLYGADANKLPLSRFKRIQSPKKWSIFVSLYIILGLFACWHLVQMRSEIVTGAYFLPFAPGNWFNLACFFIGGSFLWLALHHFYVASFGVSLKSISLKDIEITPAAVTQESILNRHLDEIIYFFQSTDYDLVVIEDLDRFNNSDIFVTLREINSLVNANAGVNRTIRFLYALRDDMFVNIDRTKFFEFIIPVIPIINSSNSIDKMLEQGRRLSLDARLDRQFLRDVSRYLNDLRLIQNIFNEYAVYVANLEADEENVLNANKLLAILIYKNVFPKDFENLHQGKGNLAQILSRREEFIAQGEAEYKAEIARLEKQGEVAERQIPADLHELRRIYAMALVEKLPQSTTHVGMTWQELIDLPSLASHASFERIIEAPHFLYRYNQGHQGRLDAPGFQGEVDSQRTFRQRRDEIEHKSAESKATAVRSIRELRAKIAVLRHSKFNEIIRLNAKGGEDLFEAFGEGRDLARFLVFEGYLDDTYYQYTSLFHSGRLSPSDNKFLIQIRGFSNPEPDFPIDNPKEVIAAMREEDFRQTYVLNVKIADCLLGDPDAYGVQKKNLLDFISANFDACEAFLVTYYASGASVPALVSGLIGQWPGFVPEAISNPRNLSHIAQIIAHVPVGTLEALPGKYRGLSDFISAQLPDILALETGFDSDRLKHLGIEVADLSAIESYPAVARLAFEEGLYQLTIANVEFVFQTMIGEADLEASRNRHYTTVLDTANSALIARIERDFDLYLQNILLALDENSQESVSAILSVLAREEVDLDDLSAFLEKQSTLIPSLDQVPARLHALVFQLAKIEASWENCLAFLASENFDAESLTGYLNTEMARAELSETPVPGDDKATALRRFIVGNDALENGAYRTYVQGLPRHFPKFPENLEARKLQILIEERKVAFSNETLASLEAGGDLQLLFVTRNIETFLRLESQFAIDDDFREALLGCEIRDEQKLAITKSMDLGLLRSLPSRAAAVGPVLDRTGADVSAFDAETARAIVVNSTPISVQISLFNKCQNVLSDEEVREILAILPQPFSEIKTGYSVPRIEKTATNIELVKWLDSRDIISSWSEALFSNEIRINLYRR